MVDDKELIVDKVVLINKDPYSAVHMFQGDVSSRGSRCSKPTGSVMSLEDFDDSDKDSNNITDDDFDESAESETDSVDDRLSTGTLVKR